ncbi:hypothetical protein GS563_14145 [Rhodococcus hoagii]|nr:hypothetical protein [Prescottella equi]
MQQDPKVRQTEIYAGQQRRMRGLQDESQVRAEVERFLALGRLYDVMLRPEKEKDAAVRFRLARLRAWRTTTTFPITLHLMERRSLGDIDSDELARALLYLESYLVRRLVFGRYSDGLNSTLLAATGGHPGSGRPGGCPAPLPLQRTEALRLRRPGPPGRDDGNPSTRRDGRPTGS